MKSAVPTGLLGDKGGKVRDASEHGGDGHQPVVLAGRMGVDA